MIRDLGIKNKFNFSDTRLAVRVRSTVLKELSKFDVNGDKLFQQDEIEQALINILNED